MLLISVAACLVHCKLGLFVLDSVNQYSDSYDLGRSHILVRNFCFNGKVLQFVSYDLGRGHILVEVMRAASWHLFLGKIEGKEP